MCFPLGARRISADDKILADLAVLCDGDMRRALNSLEVLALGLAEGGVITAAELEVLKGLLGRIYLEDAE